MSQTGHAINWELVHVFISSTFDDMHAERDYLVKKVFPELQEWCGRRKLRLVDIDLRWGVTETDATYNRNAVKVCLERIDDCRPFFLCFLGQRRGWVPCERDVSADTYQEFPELRNYIGDLSITELEILHALFNPLHRGVSQGAAASGDSLEKTEHALFYFRDPSYLEAVPRAPALLREIYTNEEIEEAAERERHDNELSRWRDKVRDRSHTYTARWDDRAISPEIGIPLVCPSMDSGNIARWQRKWAKAGISAAGTSVRDDPGQEEEAQAFNQALVRGRLTNFACGGAELKDVILGDLKQAIAKRYPDHIESTEDDDLQRELDQQDEFVYTSGEGFVRQEGAFAELDQYLASGSRQTFVLTAPGGMGKSTLLANWVARQKEQLNDDSTLHYRFIGQSDQSGTVTGLLRYLLLELQQVAGKIPLVTAETAADAAGNERTREIPFDIPQVTSRVQEIWREQLERIGSKGKTIFVIDALNELDSGLKDVAWLPVHGLPEGIQLIVSLRDDAAGAASLQKKLAARTEHVRLAQVKPFGDLKDRRQLVNAYLAHFLKELESRHLEEIVALRGASNPLFLKVVLSELRVFGSFGSLAEKIHDDFGDTPATAFAGMLRRLENDPAYSAIAPQECVPLLFGLLAHARQGLSAGELAALLVQAVPLERAPAPMEMALDAVQVFLRQVRPFLSRRGNRLDFFYEGFRDAVLRRYVSAGLTERPRRTRSAQEWHGMLATYFGHLPLFLDGPAQQRPNERKLMELTHQQRESGNWNDLYDTLTDSAFIGAAVTFQGMTTLSGRRYYSGVFLLLEDYGKAITGMRGVPEQLGRANDLRHYMEALRDASAVLVFYPELAYQELWGRIYAQTGGSAHRAEQMRQQLREVSTERKHQRGRIEALKGYAFRSWNYLTSELSGERTRDWDLYGPYAENAQTISDPIPKRRIGNSGSRAGLLIRTNYDTDSRRLQKFSAHAGRVNALAYGERTDTLYSCGRDGTLAAWEPGMGVRKATITPCGHPLLEMALLDGEASGIVLCGQCGPLWFDPETLALEGGRDDGDGPGTEGSQPYSGLQVLEDGKRILYGRGHELVMVEREAGRRTAIDTNYLSDFFQRRAQDNLSPGMRYLTYDRNLGNIACIRACGDKPFLILVGYENGLLLLLDTRRRQLAHMFRLPWRPSHAVFLSGGVRCTEASSRPAQKITLSLTGEDTLFQNIAGTRDFAALAASPDGRLLAGQTWDGAFGLYRYDPSETNTDTQESLLDGVHIEPSCALFQQGNKWVAIGDELGSIHVWDIQLPSGTTAKDDRKKTCWANGVLQGAPARVALVSTQDNDINQTYTVDLTDPSGRLLFKRLYTSYSLLVNIQRTITGCILSKVERHDAEVLVGLCEYYIWRMLFGDNHALDGSYPSSVVHYDLEKERQLDRFQVCGPFENVTHMSISADGTAMCHLTSKGRLMMRDVKRNRTLVSCQAPGLSRAAPWTRGSDGTAPCVLGLKGSRLVLYAGPEEVQCVWQNSDASQLTAMAADPSSSRVLLGDEAGFLSLVDVRTGAPACRWKAHVGSIASCEFGTDDHTAVSGGQDGLVCCWDVQSGTLMAKAAADGPLRSVSMSVQDGCVLGVDELGNAHCWQYAGSELGSPLWKNDDRRK